MTLAAIQDLLTGFPGWTTNFDLDYQDEYSGQASGVVLVKDLGPALWKMTVQSVTLTAAQLRYWKARLASLENGIGRFYGYDRSGCYPIAYPNGSWPTGLSFNGLTAVIDTINADTKRIRVGSLPPLFVLSVGDYLSVPSRGALHQVVEAATADFSGLTPLFEVRPPIRTGTIVADAVSVKQPSAVMMIMPGTVSASADVQTGFGTISFQAMQVL